MATTIIKDGASDVEYVYAPNYNPEGVVEEISDAGGWDTNCKFAQIIATGEIIPNTPEMYRLGHAVRPYYGELPVTTVVDRNPVEESKPTGIVVDASDVDVGNGLPQL